MPNTNLTAAKKAKNDEFYTQISDIEAELQHYTQHFAGKVIYCNCDNPTWSNFWRYFHLNFEHFKLKKLIASFYNPYQPVYSMEYHGGNDNNCEVGAKTPLQGNGDFRSSECVELLKEADIIVTNPPFSLFREYVAQLMEYGKKFVIIGSMNAVTYKEIFPLIRDNRLWYGPSISSGDRKFGVPDSYLLNASNCGVDENGQKYIRVKGVRWFTNLDHSKRHKPIDLVEKYSPEKYPHYDNYSAINVDKTLDIPCNYDGVIGVPISFLDKYCPEQFRIIGLDRYVEDNPKPGYRFTLNGKETYARILIRKEK